MLPYDICTSGTIVVYVYVTPTWGIMGLHTVELTYAIPRMAHAY